MARLTPARLAAHVSFWIVYLLLNALLTCLYQQLPLPDAMPQVLVGELFVLPAKLGLTYYTFYYIIPLYLDRSKLVKLVGMSLLGFVVATLVYRVVFVHLYLASYHPEVPRGVFNMVGIILALFDLFITVAAATTIKMIRLHYTHREFEQQLQREKLQSELSFLRAQTNPHFLFNTLNNLYVLARKKSDRTPDAILMLSKIMRFVLYECRAPRIPVAEEAKVIRDYIELEKLRYNERLHVHYTEVLDQPDAAIAPLLLLPFVENSFKHGASATTGDVDIAIDLSLYRNKLTFSVANTIEPDYTPNGAGGIGLKNVQRQLDLLYPGQYELSTGKNGEQYHVRLQINMDA